MSLDDELGPPPPYTPIDPLTPATSVPSLAYPTTSEGRCSTGPGQEAVARHARSCRADTTSTLSNFSSAAAYFESCNERTPNQARPERVRIHTIVIGPATTAEEVAPIPLCWPSRIGHGVSETDMQTFANYLFPQNCSTSLTNPRGKRDIKSEAQGPREQRIERIEAVSAEWNEGFFGPRGLNVVIEYTDSIPGSFPELCPQCTATLEGDLVSQVAAGPSQRRAYRSGRENAFIDEIANRLAKRTGASDEQRDQGNVFERIANRIAEQAQLHGAYIERNAQNFGHHVERHAHRRGNWVEKKLSKHGHKMENLAATLEGWLYRSDRPHGRENGPFGRNGGPFEHQSGPFGGHGGPFGNRGGGPFGSHKPYHHHRGGQGRRGTRHQGARRRRDSSSSSSSMSSSSNSSDSGDCSSGAGSPDTTHRIRSGRGRASTRFSNDRSRHSRSSSSSPLDDTLWSSSRCSKRDIKRANRCKNSGRKRK